MLNIPTWKNYKITVFLQFLIINVSLLSAIFVFLSSYQEEYYKYLFLLPFTFFVLSAFSVNIYKHLLTKTSITFLIGGYGLKMVVLPCIMVLGDYSFIGNNRKILQNMDTAIFLMCYEYFLVYLILLFSCTKNNMQHKLEPVEGQYLLKKPNLLKPIVLLIVFYQCVTFLVYPVFIHYYRLLVPVDMETHIKLNQLRIGIRDVVPSVVYWSHLFFVSISQVIIPFFTIYFIYTKQLHKKKNATYILLSFLTIFAFSIIVTPEYATTIQVSLSLLIFIIFLYPQIALKVIMSLITIGTFIVTFALIIKTTNGGYTSESTGQYLSQLLQAYFNGPINVAASLDLIPLSGLTCIIGDVGSAIPFLGYFAKELPLSSKDFNYVIYNHSNYADQIIPMLGQGYYYFGFVFSPIFSVLIVISSLSLEKKIILSENYFQKYIYIFCCIYVSISPIMYNFTIFLSGVFSQIIPCLLLCWASEKYVKI